MSNHDFSVDCDIKGEKRQLIGKAGDFDVYVYQRGMGYPARYGARSAGGVYSRNRHLPRPYPYTKFSKGRGISVGVIGGHPTGPMRHLTPQRISVDIDSQNRSLPEWRYGEIQIAPCQKARMDARRLLPVRPQQVRPFRIIGEIQNRVARFMRGR